MKHAIKLAHAQNLGSKHGFDLLRMRHEPSHRDILYRHRASKRCVSILARHGATLWWFNRELESAVRILSGQGKPHEALASSVQP
jgi:hypothetical protein